MFQLPDQVLPGPTQNFHPPYTQPLIGILPNGQSVTIFTPADIQRSSTQTCVTTSHIPSSVPHSYVLPPTYPNYTIPTTNKYSVLNEECYPALPSHDSDEELRTAGNPLEIEGIAVHENGLVLPRLGQNPNIGTKRRDLSPDSETGPAAKCKQRKSATPQANYINKDTQSIIPEQEHYKVLLEIIIEESGKNFPPDYEIAKSIQTILKNSKFELEVKKERRNMLLYLQGEDEAVKILSTSTLCNITIKTKRIQPIVRGIIKGIPLNLSIEEIKESLQTPTTVKDAIRQKRYNKESKKLEDSLAVLIIFEGRTLPPNIWCFGRKKEVYQYYRRVLQCHKCQKYGHTQKECRAKESICLRCSEKHPSNQCPLKTIDPEIRPKAYMCANCGGSHSSTSNWCPVRQQNQGILQVAEKYQIGFRMAQVAYKSYADVLNKRRLHHNQINQTSQSQITDRLVKSSKTEAAEKLVIGLLCSPDLMNLSSLSLPVRIEKLCKLVEELNLGSLNQQKISSVCLLNNASLDMHHGP